LFDGFNGDKLPFLLFGCRFRLAQPGYHAFGQQRHDAVRAEFDGFLDDGLNDFSPGHGLQKRDLTGQRRNISRVFNRQRHRMVRTNGDFTLKLMTGSVQDRHRFAALYAEHMQGMMRLAFIQLERISRAAFGWQIKTVHK